MRLILRENNYSVLNIIIILRENNYSVEHFFLRENNYSSESLFRLPNGVSLAPVLKLRGFCQLALGPPRPLGAPRVEGWVQLRAICPTVWQL